MTSRALAYSAPVVGPVAAGPEHDKPLMAFWSATELLGVVPFGFGMKGEDVPASARWQGVIRRFMVTCV